MSYAKPAELIDMPFQAEVGRAQALQIVARPPNLAVLLTHCSQLLFRKTSKFDAIRCQILC